MFTIQYETVSGEHRTQTIDSNSRSKLVAHLAHFEHPIVAVYEQATTVTKAMREALRHWPGNLSPHAREFMSRR